MGQCSTFAGHGVHALYCQFVSTGSGLQCLMLTAVMLQAETMHTSPSISTHQLNCNKDACLC